MQNFTLLTFLGLLLPVTLAHAQIPNDPLLNDQDYLFLERGGVGAPEAWQLMQQKPEGLEEVVVAIIGPGLNPNHEDLKNRLWVNEGEIPGNGIDDDQNGYVDDVHGWDFYEGSPVLKDYYNGTALAGIIAAEHNNGLGIAGIAPNARVMTISHSFHSDYGSLSWKTKRFESSDLIRYAVDNGADIIILASRLYGGRFSLAEWTEVFVENGIFVVPDFTHMRRGNEWFNLPNFIEGIFSNTDHSSLWSTISTYEELLLKYFPLVEFVGIDLAALSTSYPGTSTYSELNHSSWPAILGGCLAVLKGYYPQEAVPDLFTRLVETVEPLPGMDQYVLSGWHPNLLAALEMQKTGIRQVLYRKAKRDFNVEEEKFDLELTLSSGLTPQIEVLGGPCRVVDNELLATGEHGMVTVRVSSPGIEAYLPIEPAELSFQVNPSLLLVQPDGVSSIHELSPEYYHFHGTRDAVSGDEILLGKILEENQEFAVLIKREKSRYLVAQRFLLPENFEIEPGARYVVEKCNLSEDYAVFEMRRFDGNSDEFSSYLVYKRSDESASPFVYLDHIDLNAEFTAEELNFTGFRFLDDRFIIGLYFHSQTSIQTRIYLETNGALEIEEETQIGLYDFVRITDDFFAAQEFGSLRFLKRSDGGDNEELRGFTLPEGSVVYLDEDILIVADPGSDDRYVNAGAIHVYDGENWDGYRYMQTLYADNAYAAGRFGRTIAFQMGSEEDRQDSFMAILGRPRVGDEAFLYVYRKSPDLGKWEAVWRFDIGETDFPSGLDAGIAIHENWLTFANRGNFRGFDLSDPKRLNSNLYYVTVADLVVDAEPFPIEYLSNNTEPLEVKVLEGPADYADGMVKLTGGRGEVVLQLSQESNWRFEPSEVREMRFKVHRYSQQLEPIANPDPLYYGSEPVSLARSTSDLPVTYIVESGTAQVVEDGLDFTAPGEVQVRVVQEGNELFDPAEPLNLEFHALPKWRRPFDQWVVRQNIPGDFIEPFDDPDGDGWSLLANYYFDQSGSSLIEEPNPMLSPAGRYSLLQFRYRYDGDGPPALLQKARYPTGPWMTVRELIAEGDPDEEGLYHSKILIRVNSEFSFYRLFIHP